MANPRVHEISSIYGVQAKVALQELGALSEFVKGPYCRKVGELRRRRQSLRPPRTTSRSVADLLACRRMVAEALAVVLAETIEAAAVASETAEAVAS